FGKTHCATQCQREKTYRRCKGAKKNRPSKLCHRSCDCLLMPFAIAARLMIAPDGENREINAESDENGAKADTDHAQPSEEKLSGRKRYQAREKKAKRHARQRQPSSEP